MLPFPFSALSPACLAIDTFWFIQRSFWGFLKQHVLLCLYTSKIVRAVGITFSNPGPLLAFHAYETWFSIQALSSSERAQIGDGGYLCEKKKTRRKRHLCHTEEPHARPGELRAGPMSTFSTPWAVSSRDNACGNHAPIVPFSAWVTTGLYLRFLPLIRPMVLIVLFDPQSPGGSEESYEPVHCEMRFLPPHSSSVNPRLESASQAPCSCTQDGVCRCRHRTDGCLWKAESIPRPPTSLLFLCVRVTGFANLCLLTYFTYCHHAFLSVSPAVSWNLPEQALLSSYLYFQCLMWYRNIIGIWCTCAEI